MIGLWLWLALLVLLWKSVSSPLVDTAFHIGWVSMFLIGGITLYRYSRQRRRGRR